VRGKAGQGLDRCSGWLDLVAVPFQHRVCLAFCLGDGASRDAAKLSEHVLWLPEAQAQHGDQGLLGEAKRGPVPAPQPLQSPRGLQPITTPLGSFAAHEYH
jgi:hypothetical protein